MITIVALAAAFVVALALRARGWRWWSAWAMGGLVVPALMLAIVALQVEGWEWWPVATLFGGIYGLIASGAGVLTANLARRKRPTG